MAKQKEIKRITVHTLQAFKNEGQKISMLTAYDFSMAKIIDAAGIDIILVGDSASNVMAGHEDLPFGSYQGDSKLALRSAIRIMKEAGAHAIKLEGGSAVKESVSRILSAGIPVMGHLGLIPQSIYKFGTYTVRAKEKSEAEQLMKDAVLLEKLGCFGVVVEKIPASLTKDVAAKLKIPIIGIGGGKYADGQVLVTHDMLGITKDFNPRFLRRYLNLFDDIKGAVENYIADVQSGDFPSDKEQY
jgi:3-methyl-2-oxobutanoate hydroxymethyltransferase